MDKIFVICKKIVTWLRNDKRNVVVIQCQVFSLFANHIATLARCSKAFSVVNFIIVTKMTIEIMKIVCF